MNRIIAFFKKYYSYTFIGISLIFLFIFSLKYLDNDTWWLLNTGRYIWKHGFFYTDPFSIHEGLHMIVQQWLFSYIIWGFYKLGEVPLFIFMTVIVFFITIVMYKLCYLVSQKQKISIFLTMIFIVVITPYITIRPQIMTYLNLLLELFFLEKYALSNNKKYLYFLPFVSVLMINMHASMWIMQFICIGPFIVNAMFPKKWRKDIYDLKPLIIVLIIMFLVGFINPYGYKSVFYLFYSYPENVINTHIYEMSSPTFENFLIKIVLAATICIICFINFIKKFKIDVRHFFLLSGLLVFAFMHLKSIVYYYLVCFYIMAYGFRNVNINTIEFKNKYLCFLTLLLKEILVGLIILSFCYTYYYKCKILDYTNPYQETFDYLLDNYNKDEIVLFTEYVDGGYAEFRGVKAYIDPRAEVFMKKFNNKADILDEYYGLNDDNVEAFINKYQFTHLLVSADSDYMLDYLDENDNYKKIYTQKYKTDDDVEVTLGYLYIKLNNVDDN